MGARHRQRKAAKTSFATESRELRKAQHRAQRHTVRQTLHETHVDNFDDVVLPEPKATRGRIEPEDRTPVEIEPRTFKAWKQPFWKRRVNERRERALAYRRLATD